MINIVFLLLIFFMVASQIGAPDGDIRPPQSSSQKPVPAGQVELSLTAGGDLLQQGQPLSIDQLPDLISDQASGGGLTVVLKADQTALAEDLDRVFAVLRSQGISLITLRTLNPEAPQ
nr:biopolymer transporter ExbD [Marinobacter sediminum]